MTDAFQIKEKGSYELMNVENFYFQQPYELSLIQKVHISPNEEFIALVIKRQRVQSYTLFHDYRIVFKIMENGQIREGNWFKAEFNFTIYSQFTSDSKYFVSHSMLTMSIEDLIQFHASKIKQIDTIYTIDNQNQVYLFKEENIQIYQIKNQSFLVKIQMENSSPYLYQMSQQLFLGIEEKFDIFQFQKVLKKTFQYLIQLSNCNFTIKNNFLITFLKIFENRKIYFRNLRNFKLIRQAPPLLHLNSNLINERNNIYTCWVEMPETQNCQRINKFNLITGCKKSMKLKMTEGRLHDQIQITNNIILDINESQEKMRHFIFSSN